MKKLVGLLAMTLVLAGCFAAKPPAWLASGHKWLDTFKEDYLTNQEPKIAETAFRKALQQIKNGGDFDLLAKAWLNRIALQAAVLQEPNAGDYRNISAVESNPTNDNFFLFLTENVAVVDVSLLPAAYRPFCEALKARNVVMVADTVAGIKDPLSRLIASGLAVRNNLYSEALILAAVKTAAENGWKRAHLAWLERLKTFYAVTANSEKAEAIGRRLDILR
jgi:hypothetical protein